LHSASTSRCAECWYGSLRIDRNRCRVNSSRSKSVLVLCCWVRGAERCCLERRIACAREHSPVNQISRGAQRPGHPAATQPSGRALPWRQHVLLQPPSLEACGSGFCRCEPKPWLGYPRGGIILWPKRALAETDVSLSVSRAKSKPVRGLCSFAIRPERGLREQPGQNDLELARSASAPIQNIEYLGPPSRATQLARQWMDQQTSELFLRWRYRSE
jgi:hypothetical protein